MREHLDAWNCTCINANPPQSWQCTSMIKVPSSDPSAISYILVCTLTIQMHSQVVPVIGQNIEYESHYISHSLPEEYQRRILC